jgi:hypothetical protein
MLISDRPEAYSRLNCDYPQPADRHDTGLRKVTIAAQMPSTGFPRFQQPFGRELMCGC